MNVYPNIIMLVAMPEVKIELRNNFKATGLPPADRIREFQKTILGMYILNIASFFTSRHLNCFYSSIGN
jgi:hypothetical protein